MTESVPADEYTLADLMCVAAARFLPPKGHVLLGMGLPVLSGTLAKLLYYPDLKVSTEVGVFDWQPDPETIDRAPIGIADLCLNVGAAMVSDMVDGLGTVLMGGNVDIAFLGAAQIDKYGNLNTLVIGDYHAPTRRLGGAGGNTEAACLARRVVTTIPLEPRRFVERVDFITSPGYIDGPGGRRRHGLDTQGPNAVVTTMGIFRFDTPDGGDSGTCEMYLDSIFPGVSLETIQALVPWEIKTAPQLEQVAPPTAEELHWLRRLDRLGMYLRPGRY